MMINSDLPILHCISCERLRRQSDLRKLDNYRYKIDNEPWKELINKYVTDEINGDFICKSCSKAFSKGKIPFFSIFQYNLYGQDIPPDIAVPISYEKILIQRAKAFQTVKKLDSKIKIHVPNYCKLDALKGRTFHLPLPIKETLKKICPDTSPLNTDHVLYILSISFYWRGTG